MNNKMKIKRMIDLAMTVILLALMAFQITWQELHEWLGAGMLVLFLVHNILNFKWYKNLFKGKYSPLRALQTMLNVSILVAVLYLAYSGIIMSGYVFDFGQSGISVFMEYTAMMGLWVFLGYYFAKGLQKLTSAKRKKDGAGQ